MLHLELPPEVEAQLEAEAAKRGISKEDYVLHKLLLPEPEPASIDEEVHPLIRLTEEIFGEIPEAERETPPPDYAINHNHYIHGAPKREE